MEKKLLEMEFKLRLYTWAVKDAHREVNDNFPFLKTLKNVAVSRTLQILETFPKPEQITIFIVLTKLSYIRLRVVANINLTIEEEYLLELFQKKQKSFPEYETDLFYELYKKKSFVKIPIKKTKSLVMQELNLLMDCEENDRNFVSYIKLIEKKWLISTNVQIESSGISYYHVVYLLHVDKTFSSDEERFKQRLYLKGSISFYAWLGFNACGGWTFYKEEDFIIATKTLAKACNHFLNAAPSLLDGLI